MGTNQLAGAVRRIAWAYILLHINFNLGAINLLPNWLGYILILGALPILGIKEPSALLLRPLGILLALWEGVCWLLPILGSGETNTILNLIAAVLSLYFHFQLLTNLANLARHENCPEQNEILHLRTARTLLITVLSLPIPWTQYEGLTICFIIANLIAAVWLCSVLFSLRKSLNNHPSSFTDV